MSTKEKGRPGTYWATPATRRALLKLARLKSKEAKKKIGISGYVRMVLEQHVEQERV